MRLAENESKPLATAAILPLAQLLCSAECRALFEGLAKSKLTINKQLAIQFRKMTPASPAFDMHVDLIEYPSLIALFYVAPDWQEPCGGELILSPLKSAGRERHKLIAPLANRLVLFMTHDEHWHGVNRVFGWDRLLVLAEWLITA